MTSPSRRLPLSLLVPSLLSVFSLAAACEAATTPGADASVPPGDTGGAEPDVSGGGDGGGGEGGDGAVDDAKEPGPGVEPEPAAGPGCESECTVAGSKRCLEDAVQTCLDFDANGCLEWGGNLDCISGTKCSNGFCAIACEADCTILGAHQCSPDGVQTCTDSDFDGCLEWSAGVACPGGQVCSNGSCASNCTSECSVFGAAKCEGAAVRTCGDANGDGCLEWGAPAECGAGLACSNGHCAVTCQDECVVAGASVCDGAGPKTCGDADGNGCLEWGTVVPCGDGQTCSSGKCAATCDDECGFAGEHQCLGAAVQTCGDTDADPCLKWGTADPCGPGAVCDAGFCTTGCDDGCAVQGEKVCAGDGFQVCGDPDGDGCLDYGPVVACEGGQACAGGNCTTGCDDECASLGEKSCAGPGEYEVCGDLDGDPCLEWGPPIPCGGGEVCEAGNCALDCEDECGSVGQKQCTPSVVAFEVCGDLDGDGCLEWSDEVACEGGSLCESGTCATSCTDLCGGPGLKSCSDDGGDVLTCADHDEDGCVEWGAPSACGAAATCADGACQEVPVPGKLRINELLYDALGSDESGFVELRGDPGLDVTGYVLQGVNGANGETYGKIALQGSVTPLGFFVVATPTSNPILLDDADQIDPAADYQNGPDSVQLLWGETLVDAVGYGDFSAAVFAGEGNPAPDVPEGQTLGRDGSGTDTNDNETDFFAIEGSSPGFPNSAANDLPTAKLSCPAGGKAGESLTFSGTGSTDPDGTIKSYAFAFGDGSVLTSPIPTVSHTYQVAKTYTVTLTVTDNQNAQAKASCLVSLSDPTAPKVTWVKPTSDLEVTQGDHVDMVVDAQPAPGFSVAEAVLVVDGVATGAPDTKAPYTFGYDVPANAVTGSLVTLHVQVTDSKGAVGLSPARVLSVLNAPPVASFVAFVAGKNKVSVDAGGSSDAEVASGFLTFRWDWESDGAFDTDPSNVPTATHTYAAGGKYTITLEVKDPVGQTSTTKRTVDFQSVLDVSGTVTTTTWFGTVNVTGDILVPAGQVLTVAPGTTVIFVEVDQDGNGLGDYEMTVQGKLVLDGTAEDPVVVTALDSSATPAPKAWGGILLAAGSQGHDLAHAVIERADVALDVQSNDAAFEDLEVRQSRIGVRLGTGTLNVLGGLVHGNLEEGVSVTGGNLQANGLTVRDNGRHGILVAGGLGHLVQDALVEANEGAGVYWRGNAGGTLTKSQVRENAEEGIRVLRWDDEDPAPVVQLNNIHDNGLERNLAFGNVNVSVASSYSGTSTVTSAKWDAPGGAEVVLAEVTYSESYTTSTLTGKVQSGDGSKDLATIANASAKKWVGLAGPATSVRAQVVDSEYYGSGDLTIHRVAYLGPAAGRNVAVVLASKTFDLRFNWLGAWPNVLGAVLLESPGGANLQGFVSAPFGPAFSTGNHFGGRTLDADTVWDSDVWVTGDVTVGAGKTLSILPGVEVVFLPIDQEADGIGDYQIERGDGTLLAAGTKDDPVLFTVHLDPPAGGGYQWVDGEGSGESTFEHVVFEGGRTGIRCSAGQVSANDVTVVEAANQGSRILGSCAFDAVDLVVQGAAGDALEVGTSGPVVLDRPVLDGAGQWGLDALSAKNAGNTMSDAEITGNAAGGVRLSDSTMAIEHVNLKFNGFGLWADGSAAGSLSASNVQFNDREGLVAGVKNGAQPTFSITGNNVFGNSVAEALLPGTSSLSAASSYSGTSTAQSGVWTSPAGAILFLHASYSESYTTSTLTGRVQTQSGLVLKTFENAVALSWHEVVADGAQSVQAVVVDSEYYGSGAVDLPKVAYLAGTVSPPRVVELTVVRNSGKLVATGNYWGVFPSVQDVVQELVSGTVDYTGFKSSEITGTGPQ